MFNKLSKDKLILIAVVAFIIFYFIYCKKISKENFSSLTDPNDIAEAMKQEACESLAKEKAKIKKVLEYTENKDEDDLETREQINYGSDRRNNISRDIVLGFHGDECEEKYKDYLDKVKVVTGPELYDMNMESGYEPSNQEVFERTYAPFNYE